MATDSLRRDCRPALLAIALLCGCLPAVAQPGGQGNPPAAEPSKPPAANPALSGKGPLRLPPPAEPSKAQATPAAPFSPSERVRADADVAFPADI